MDIRPADAILKWRDVQQEGLLRGSFHRVSSTYRGLVNRALGQRCLIYIPSGGAPSERHLEAHYIAEATIAAIHEDPFRTGFLILCLEDYRFFAQPVPLRVEGRETADPYKLQGIRNHSAEQRAVLEVDRRWLNRIVQFGRLPIGLESDEDPAALDATFPGFAEAEPTEPENGRERERYERILRDWRVHRRTAKADAGRCVICGFTFDFEGSSVGLVAAHIRAAAEINDDSLRNTLLMHSFYHALFDCFAFSLTDDLHVIWSRSLRFDELVPTPYRDGRAHVDRSPDLLPDPRHLRWHRERFEERERERRS